MLKIIAGEFRSRQLLAPPDGVLTRPYLSRVRESVFGMLRGWFEGASVLDLFSGVGTMGLEAVSRGADRVLLVEQNKRVYALLKENIEALGCRDRATSMLGDALGAACLARVTPPVDLVFVDPPYTMMMESASRSRVLAQIARCHQIMSDGFVVLRSPLGPEECDVSIPGFEGPEPHRYGRDMWVLLYQPLHQPAGSNGTLDEGTPVAPGESDS